MPTYSVIRKSDNKQVYGYNHDAPLNMDMFPFTTHDHIEVVTPPDVVPVTGQILTPLAFLRRFTQKERKDIRNAAKNNDDLLDYLEMIGYAQEIDTADADTRAGVNMLEAVGMIAEGRAEEILNG